MMAKHTYFTTNFIEKHLTFNFLGEASKYEWGFFVFHQGYGL